MESEEIKANESCFARDKEEGAVSFCVTQPLYLWVIVGLEDEAYANVK